METQKRRTVRTALEAAREIIADKKRWTQGAMFRNKHGNEVASPEQAVRCCAMGAVTAVTATDQTRRAALRALQQTARELGLGDIVIANDSKVLGGRTRNRSGCHEDVLKMFDAAIEEAS